MRSWLGTLAVLVTFGVVLAGPAAADPGAPGTAWAPDHFGVLAGSADAPVQLEVFCDPQCSECAKFVAASGDDLGSHLVAGDVAVTYRWMTFLDARRGNDTSARVGNALMAASDPATSAATYQTFVSELYRRAARRAWRTSRPPRVTPACPPTWWTGSPPDSRLSTPPR